MPSPTKIAFSVVQRPGGTGVLPAALIDAIAKTVTSGQALRIDGTTWSENRRRTVYRALHTLGLSTPYAIMRRRTDDGVIYVWGVRK